MIRLPSLTEFYRVLPSFASENEEDGAFDGSRRGAAEGFPRRSRRARRRQQNNVGTLKKKNQKQKKAEIQTRLMSRRMAPLQTKQRPKQRQPEPAETVYRVCLTEFLEHGLKKKNKKKAKQKTIAIPRKMGS